MLPPTQIKRPRGGQENRKDRASQRLSPHLGQLLLEPSHALRRVFAPAPTLAACAAAPARDPAETPQRPRMLCTAPPPMASKQPAQDEHMDSSPRSCAWQVPRHRLIPARHPPRALSSHLAAYSCSGLSLPDARSSCAVPPTSSHTCHGARVVAWHTDPVSIWHTLHMEQCK